jgi:hypothetical protein
LPTGEQSKIFLTAPAEEKFMVAVREFFWNFFKKITWQKPVHLLDLKRRLNFQLARLTVASVV